MMHSGKIFSRRFVWLPLAALLLAATGFAANAPRAAAKAAKPAPKDAMAPGSFSLRLKPKSFQKNPELAMTVITEMTPEGLKRAQVSPEAPAYYGMQSLGQKTYGESDPGKVAVPAERIKGLMQTALAQNGYLTAKTPDHPPTLALVYQWGLHGGTRTNDLNAEITMLVDLAEEGMDLTPAERIRNKDLMPGGVQSEIDKYLMNGQFRPTDGDNGKDKRNAQDLRDELEHSPQLRLEWLVMNAGERKNLEQRAALVGGKQFAYDLQQILEKNLQITLRARGAGIFFPEMSRAPLQAALTADRKISHLFYQSAYDIYFVMVVAYDFDDYVRGGRNALWSTKMTVNTEGVSMVESLPSVIEAAAPYFGRQMPEAATLLQQIHRGDKVEIGPLRVLGPEAEPAAKAEKK